MSVTNFSNEAPIIRMGDYQKPKTGSWVVRRADYQKAGGDINACEWLYVASVVKDTVTVENYGSESGDILTETGKISDFVCTGMQEPNDTRARILEGIEKICPNLTDEEWQCVRMMVGED